MPLLTQLLSYSLFEWALFVAIALVAASAAGVSGMFFGHVIVAAIICVSDLRWIESEMRRPGWDGVPDRDFVFLLGMCFRVVVVNTLLLPITFLGLALRRRRSAGAGSANH